MIDKRYLIIAYRENMTGAGMSAYESGLGFNTQGTNKTQRATLTINYLFDRAGTDELVLDLLNYVFVQNPTADLSNQNTSFVELRNKVLLPRGIELTEDGFRFASRPSDSLTTMSTTSASVGTLANVFDNLNPKSVIMPESESAVPSNKTVFVVHGRDMRPVEQIQQFLMFLGLTMMRWSEAIALTNNTQPHTYDIVKAGMENAAAIVVIFSPDDEARVKRQFASPSENTDYQGQARQNVLVEAGMAFAHSPKKTIFVQSENTRSISDLEGFNWVKLNGEWDSREDFINRLKLAGADARPMHGQLTHSLAGAFKVV